MFVQSAQFVTRHEKRAAEELTVFGTEKANDTVKRQDEPRGAWPLGRHPRIEHLTTKTRTRLWSATPAGSTS